MKRTVIGGGRVTMRDERGIECEIETSAGPRPHVGQRVIWLQQRKWGGKQNVPAKYLHGVGHNSARIEIEGGEEKTVRLKSLTWETKDAD